MPDTNDSPAYVPEQIVQRVPHATATTLDENTAVVLDLNDQTYYELNASGYVLWQHLEVEEEATVSDLVTVLRNYAASLREEPTSSVSREMATEQVHTFLATMHDADLIILAS